MSRSRATSKAIKCPKCRSVGYVRTPDAPTPTLVYRTESFDTMVQRYRICTVCAYKWVTTERFDRAVGETSA